MDSSDEEPVRSGHVSDDSSDEDLVRSGHVVDQFAEDEGLDDLDAQLYDEFRGSEPPTPGVVRSKLRKLIAGGLKVKKVQALIGERAGPQWGKFMSNAYKHQSSSYANDAYRKAAFFFFKEKKLGKQGELEQLKKTTAAKKAKAKLPDLSDVETDGKTWLTPGEVRKTIRAMATKFDGLAQASLAKRLGVNAGSVSAFMSARGEFGADGNCCYHGLAKFCEQVRISTGTAKSEKRLAIEAEGRAEPFLGQSGRGSYIIMEDVQLGLGKDAIGRQIIKTVYG